VPKTGFSIHDPGHWRPFSVQPRPPPRRPCDHRPKKDGEPRDRKVSVCTRLGLPPSFSSCRVFRQMMPNASLGPGIVQVALCDIASCDGQLVNVILVNLVDMVDYRHSPQSPCGRRLRSPIMSVKLGRQSWWFIAGDWVDTTIKTEIRLGHSAWQRP